MRFLMTNAAKERVVGVVSARGFVGRERRKRKQSEHREGDDKSRQSSIEAIKAR